MKVSNGMKALVLAGLVFGLAACSSTPKDDGSANANANSAGAATPGSAEDFRVNVGDRVFFATDQYTLDNTSRETLRKQAAWLQQYQGVTLMVEGHCDERGTREYNLALGERRSNAVRDYLVSLGVNASRLQTISYGKERPTCTEATETCWAENRRGVSVVSGAAGS